MFHAALLVGDALAFGTVPLMTVFTSAVPSVYEPVPALQVDQRDTVVLSEPPMIEPYHCEHQGVEVACGA